MNLSVGIVGLPNAGKSTLFNALLKKQVAFAANYPFATIEPNVGVVPVPDERLEKLADVIAQGNPSTSLRVSRPPVVPATVRFVDIAGLVSGASKGEGLGNQFLSHIREVDLICHLTRAFTDPDIIHVSGDVDPKRDIETIETELILADLQTLDKQQPPKGKAEKEVLRRWELVEKLKHGMQKSVRAVDIITDHFERLMIRDLNLLTMKPYLEVLNVSDTQVLELSKEHPETFIISAKTEEELASLSEEEQKEYLKSIGLEQSGLERMIKKAYQLLQLISFLTAGVKEVRAWTIGKGTKADAAAGVIHTDFAKGFIKAEVISYNEFVKFAGWQNAREKGKVRFEGRDYLVMDGDVVDFKVNS